MKKNQFQNLSRCFVVTLLAVVVSSTIARSQNKVVLTPLGENTSGYRADVSLNASVTGFGQVDVSSDHVSCNYIATRIIGDVYANPPVWKPKSPGIIIAAKSTPGRPGAKGKYVYLLKVLVRDDATGYVIVHVLDYTLANSQTGPVDHPDPPLKVGLDYGQSWVQVDGDATYVRSSAYVFVYRDSVSSWQIDSTGVGNSITGISLDTAQNVYAASTNGVFKQNPDSNVWHQITNLPTSNFSNILVDRRDNIFAANYVSYNGKGTYVSTDNGASWTLDSAGIGKQQILKLSDDAYGNTYAIANGFYQIYRRMNNTPGWTRIDGGITAITVNPTTINSVGGDSILLAATSFGLFASTDQGTTWTEDNANNPATSFSSFAKGAGGKWFTTTSLAMYSLGPTDTAWTKVFPTTGYLSLLNIYTDGIGNIYTANYNSTYLSKSSNNGSTWSPDTAGGGVVPQCIDEKGGQHAGYLWKPYGGSWGWDTVGFQVTNSNNNYTAAIASDHHGYLYLSGEYFNGSARVNGQVMRRPINGGAWVVDTVGLANYSYLDALYPGKYGDMYGTYRPNLVHRSNNGMWSTLKLPSIAEASHVLTMVLSVDSSGAVFIAPWGEDVSIINKRGLGVYFSTDTGATWKYAGLDSITVNQLVSYGDSTYAATNNGLYILTRTAVPVTSVQHAANVPMSYALFQNYPNPFNPSTTIRFQLATKSRVTLKVYDILGREVETLVDGALDTGLHQVSFEASRFASGVYFYRIQAGSFAATKKLILLK